MHLKPEQVEQQSRYWELLFFASLFLIGGLSGLIWGPKDYYSKELNKRVLCYSAYFKRGSQGIILNALKYQNFNILENLRDNEEMGLRLDIVASTNMEYVRYRLYQLVGYGSKPISEILSLNKKDAYYFLKGGSQDDNEDLTK